MADYGDALAGMSRSGNVLQSLGYDPEDLKADPALRAQVMQSLTAPMQVAQNATPPNPRTMTGAPANPNPTSPNGNSLVPEPGQPRLFNRVQPTAPVAPPPASLAPPSVTPKSMATGVSPSVAPATANSPDITNARQAAGNLLAPEPALPDTTADDTTIAAKSAPINPDQKQYKESFWGNVGRGLNDFREGFAGHPEKVVDYSAPNEQYRTDDAQRQSQLGNAQRDRANILERFKQMSDQRKQQDTASHDAGEISNTTADIPIKQQTADADTQNAATNATKASYESPTAKGDAVTAEIDARRQEAKVLGLKGSEAERYSLGKTGEQFAPNESIIAAQQGLAAWRKDNPGKTPGLEDYNKIREAAQGKLDSTAGGGADPQLIDSIGTGKIAPDRLGYLLARNPALISAVATKYPDFDSSKIAAYPQVYKDFTSSKPNTAGGTLNAAATAFKHLSELQELNTAESRIPGTEDYQKFQNKLDTVAPELAKAYNDSTVSGIETYKKSLGAMFNRDAAIQTQAKSLGDKVDSLEQTWKNAAPSKSYEAPVPGMDDAAMRARAKLDSRYVVPSKSNASGTFDWNAHPVVKP